MITRQILLSLFIFICTQQPANAIFPSWEKITNPVYDRYGFCVKDACMINREGVWYVFASFFYYKNEGLVSHVACIKTRDFITYSEPIFVIDGHAAGWKGMASPDIVLHEGKYYLTYNSWGDREGKPNQLFYAVSEDLIHWEFDKPLAANLTQGKRAIDAALAFEDGRCFLVYKEGQKPIVAYADSPDSKQWVKIGSPAIGWFENAQLIRIDNCWHLVATVKRKADGTATEEHGPAFSRMLGDPASPASWMQWEPFRAIHADIPVHAYSINEKANAAFLVDNRDADGHFYLLAAARTEGVSFGRRGDCRLVLYRSTDLIKWFAPKSKSVLVYTEND